MLDLTGRKALITGGSRGAGKAIAQTFARYGADIVITYNRDIAAAQETVDSIKALGKEAFAIKVNISNYEEVQNAIDYSVRQMGSIDILVNNAGIASRGQTVAETAIEELHNVMDVHFFGSFHCCQLALPILRQAERADILFISSVATKTFSARGVPYGAAKAAMEALAKGLAKEERQNGIRVNVIAPSLFESEMGRRLVRATQGIENIRDLDEKSPFGVVLQPEEIGEIASFLCSNQNFRISGQVIYVDCAS